MLVLFYRQNLVQGDLKVLVLLMGKLLRDSILIFVDSLLLQRKCEPVKEQICLQMPFFTCQGRILKMLIGVVDYGILYLVGIVVILSKNANTVCHKLLTNKIMLYITGCLLKIKLKRCKEVKEKTHTQSQETFSQLSCKTCCSVACDYSRPHGDESSSHPRA